MSANEGSSAPLDYEQLQEIQNNAEYQGNHKDRYVGDVDPVTKLRHGQGTYTYQENSFFQYQGHWNNGIKETAVGQASTFLLRDGTKYTGNFQKGEITGQGLKEYGDGRVYQGSLVEGEMHGQGCLVYSKELKDEKDMSYEGQFHLNSREGQGVLTKRNGDRYSGTFQGNQPNGETEIKSANGDFYKGNVVRGVINGQGHLQCDNKCTYQGEFKESKLHGEGTFSVEGGTYRLSGQFTEGVPQYQASKYLLEVTSPKEEEDDPKAKGGKDVKKGAPPVDEGEGTGNAIKIIIDTANPEELRRQLGLKFDVVFQGEPYEDPNPPEEDLDAKGKKGGKPATGEPEVRMITPEPVLLENETGRLFEIQLGRNEQVRVETTPIENAAESLEGASQAAEEADPVTEEKWIQYKFDQSQDSLAMNLPTEKGVLNIENIVYQLNETFTAGNFEIVITDITQGIPDEQKLEQMRLDLKLYDSEAEAEAAAALAAAGGKKKK